eukprot:CAMPEP_0177636794 /NCGR_PEP_ID=MMETSP0447-20121125/4625_1 /TAXON_ID=0 /ORGANISM="Stygamoeba regulata, Strain BSH-02190019" /LENGTH=261 /DNA_ID=CAMNT_0019138673 /DNA_START=147 /DNA_END=932 /DNA_ORIENTATION=+
MPAFVWTGDEGAHLSTSDVQSLPALVAAVAKWHEALSTKALLFFVYDSLPADTFSRLARNPATPFPALKAALAARPQSAFFPALPADGHLSTGDLVAAALPAGVRVVRVQAGEEDVETAVEAALATPAAVVVSLASPTAMCGDDSSAQLVYREADAVMGRALKAAEKVVGRSYIAFVSGTPEPSFEPIRLSRRNAQDDGSGYTNSETASGQNSDGTWNSYWPPVVWEAVIVMFLFIVLLVSGFRSQLNLQTPDRFETPKKE